MLEYALKEMWRKRQSRVIGHALYEAAGKVEGAISQHADAVLHALPEADQLLALRALTRLVRVAGEENEADTRLRLPLIGLPEAEREILQTFVAARLLVAKREEGADAETIEVAHEALIRRWEKLRKALDSDREFLMWRRHLAYRTKAWEQKGRDIEWLLYGGELDEAQHWLNERGAELTAAEIGFITWDDRPDFQIERTLSEGSSLLPYSYDETCKSWFATLVFCCEKEKALSIARETKAARGHAKALRFIAPALVKIGLATEALAVAHEIENSYSRARALSSIARMLVKVGMAKDARETVAKALAAAREIENTRYHAPALSSIAKAQAKAGMVTEALATAHEIKGWYKYEETLSLISETLVEVGMPMEALAVAREIEGSYFRARALRSIVEAMVEDGMVLEALAVSREIEYSYSRAQTLYSIVEALGKVGLAMEAREAAMEAREAMMEALAVARRHTGVAARVDDLSSIAEDLMKAGMITEAREAAMEARETATKTLAAAREIKDTTHLAVYLRYFYKELLKWGMMAEALAAAREIKDAYDRAATLHSIAEKMVESGMLTEALATAGEIEFAYNRAGVLMAVADFLLERRQDDDAWSLLEETQSVVSEVFNDEQRSGLMRHLSVILARLHSYRAARETAEQCATSSDRLAAYTAILREYNIERDPSLARLFAEEKEEEEDD